MTVTKTFEPLRPLRAPDGGSAYFVNAMDSIGSPRVDYGWPYWPSRSYWLVPQLLFGKDS